MNLRIEYDWSQYKGEMGYYIYRDNYCLYSCATLEEARKVFEQFKKRPPPQKPKEVIESIDIPDKVNE